jgi:hypothetical protein
MTPLHCSGSNSYSLLPMPVADCSGCNSYSLLPMPVADLTLTHFYISSCLAAVAGCPLIRVAQLAAACGVKRLAAAEALVQRVLRMTLQGTLQYHTQTAVTAAKR